MQTIPVEVLLFAGAADLAGTRKLNIEMAPGSTIAECRATLVELYPRLKSFAAHSRWAVDGEFVGEGYELANSRQIAMIPPVSGG